MFNSAHSQGQSGQPRKASLQRLPNELPNRICLDIQDQLFSQKTLACFARTCKKIHGVAHIFLYNKIGIFEAWKYRLNEFADLPPFDRRRLLRTLVGNSHLASLVKTVGVFSFFPPAWAVEDQMLTNQNYAGSYGRPETRELCRTNLRSLTPIWGPAETADLTAMLLLCLMHNVSRVSLEVNETWDLDVLPRLDTKSEWKHIQTLYLASRPCEFENFRPPSGFGLQRALPLLALMPRLQQLTLHFLHHNPLEGHIELPISDISRF